MKTCPNCGEMNGEANDKCYKCGADLSERYCTYCDKVYSSKTHTCPACGSPTVVYDAFTMKKQTYNNSSDYVDTWMYVLAVLIPLVGLILGCIQIGKNNSTGGRNLIIAFIVSSVVCTIIWYIAVYGSM